MVGLVRSPQWSVWAAAHAPEPEAVAFGGVEQPHPDHHIRALSYDNSLGLSECRIRMLALCAQRRIPDLPDIGETEPP